MKTIAFLFISLSLPAFASNPQIRICNVTGGVFQSLKIDADEVGFCKYGSALIDALTVMNVTSNSDTSLAAEAVQNSPAQSCSDANAADTKAQNLEGLGFDLCSFDDGTFVELSTLKAGPQSSSNAQLVKALKIRF